MDALLDEAMMRFNAALGFGFLAGWAFVVISLVYNVALGFLNRALPQLMVALVGAPFIVGVGLVLLAMASVALLMMWSQALPGMLDWL
jgi:flagellar biosynthetic protein FliR